MTFRSDPLDRFVAELGLEPGDHLCFWSVDRIRHPDTHLGHQALGDEMDAERLLAITF